MLDCVRYNQKCAFFGSKVFRNEAEKINHQCQFSIYCKLVNKQIFPEKSTANIQNFKIENYVLKPS
jgi:hypothetical protein